MVKLSAFVGLSIWLFLVKESLSHEASTNKTESLDSENELKRMLSFVRPLMGILRSDPRIKRSTDLPETGWLSSSRTLPKEERDGGGSYGGSYGGGSSYGYESCCNDGHDYLGLISLISLGLLFLFLIQLLSTTTAAAARKKRSNDNDLHSLEELLSQEDIGMGVI